MTANDNRSKIGIEVITTTAREQELLRGVRDSQAYYEDHYSGKIGKEANKIIEKYTDCNWEIDDETVLLKDGKVRNIIIFVFYNKKGYDKKALRAELEALVKEKTASIFE